jgi:CheY-like chemotaxis protein
MRVLLVEDNPDDAALSQRAVLRAVPETELELARDGQEAVDRLLDPSQPLPDLVLLDLKLPRVDGIELLRRVRAETRTRVVPIVMLTSSDERSDVAACYGAGVNSYLRKPVDFDQFMLIVGNAARYWLSANVAPPLGTLP